MPYHRDLPAAHAQVTQPIARPGLRHARSLTNASPTGIDLLAWELRAEHRGKDLRGQLRLQLADGSAAVAALRDLAAGRGDLLARAAGVLEGFLRETFRPRARDLRL
jgi:hypothetical protein